MEPRFEVRYYANYNMLAEFARKYSIGPRIPLVIAFWVWYVFLLGFCLLNGITAEFRYILLSLGLFMLLFGFAPQWYAWMTVRNVKKQNDGVQPESVVTVGDTIEMHEGMVHFTIEYRKIVNVVRLKHSYVLMLGKRNGILLDPNGFTKGTFEEFKQFLRETYPDMVIPE